MFSDKKEDSNANEPVAQGLAQRPAAHKNEFFRWRWTDTAGAVGVCLALLAAAIAALQALTHV